MIVLSAADATLLALIADNPHMPAPEFDRIKSRLGPESQKIAGEIVRVIVDKSNRVEVQNAQDPIVQAAQSIVTWAKGNKKPTVGVSKTAF